jgi:hypothetical protein
MADRTQSYCRREDVGVVYRCLDAGAGERCKHYKESPQFGDCKWYSYAKYDSCTCKEAQEEADAIGAPRKAVQ